MRLGEILIERKLITNEDLERALELQKERGDKLGKTLVDMGFVAMRDAVMNDPSDGARERKRADQRSFPGRTFRPQRGVRRDEHRNRPRFVPRQRGREHGRAGPPRRP